MFKKRKSVIGLLLSIPIIWIFSKIYDYFDIWNLGYSDKTILIASFFIVGVIASTLLLIFDR